MFHKTFMIVTLVVLHTADVVAETQVELVTTDSSFVGKPVAHNQFVSWLAKPDGSYSPVMLHQVKSFSRSKESFSPETTLAMRNRLQRELGKDYEVTVKGKFVVAGPVGRAKIYADLLDKMSRSFSRYTSLRKLPRDEVEFPLLVQVFADRREFDAYCRQDEVSLSSLLKGYYSPRTNRIALYEERLPAFLRVGRSSSSKITAADLPPETVQTLIHEGIHQLAFNVGLHSRIGANPRWVVEGLAEMMEGDSRMNVSLKKGDSSINDYRLTWFHRYSEKSRSETIADFVADDDKYFARNTLDAYSEAWALTYFLAETRPRNYVSYLKRVASRDPLDRDYSAKERLTDFQAEFGEDLPWLEVQFLRYVKGLQSN